MLRSILNSGKFMLPLFLTGLVWAVTAIAGPCFAPIYYEHMFEPRFLEADSGGDSRLIGASDYVAAKGEDSPDHGHGAGCHGCSTNNGRWDQMFWNMSLEDAARVPVSFVLERIQIEPLDKEGRHIGRQGTLSSEVLASCFGTPVTLKGSFAFDAEQGLSARPDVIEPGEAVIGCLCLAAEDRHKSGTVKVTVSYRLAVHTLNLVLSAEPSAPVGDSVQWKGAYRLENLSKGQGRYFRLLFPDGAYPGSSGVTLRLNGATDTELHTRPGSAGWTEEQSDWTSGTLQHLSGIDARESWVMVRSLADGGGVELEVVFQTSTQGAETLTAKQSETPPSGFALTDLNPGQERVFKAFVLGQGDPSSPAGVDLSNPLRPCCGPAGE